MSQVSSSSSLGKSATYGGSLHIRRKTKQVGKKSIKRKVLSSKRRRRVYTKRRAI